MLGTEDISLSEYGWTGCFIPTNLKDIINKLPTWRHLHILRPPEKHNSRKILFPWDFFQNDKGKQYIPAFELLQPIGIGSYGTVYSSRRAVYEPVTIPSPATDTMHLKQTQSFTDIVSKVSPIEILPEEAKHPERCEAAFQEEIQAVLYEAALHAILNKLFEAARLPTVVPKLYEVVAVSKERHPIKASQISQIYINMEFIEGQTLFDFLQEFFKTPKTEAENEELLLDVLIQLCVYMDILQSHLRFNHRDLKINNILFRTTASHKSPHILHHALGSEKVTWKCKNDLVIIDFGFSCIACDEPCKKTLFQAGSWFTQKHDCMKPGRDLALFLYSFETYFPLRGKITDQLFEILKRAMVGIQTGHSPVDLWNGVSEKGVPHKVPHPLSFHSGIYKYLRMEDVEIPGCAPKILLKHLLEYANRKS